MAICFGNVLSDLGTERTKAFSHFKGSVRTQESHLPPVLRLYFFPFWAIASKDMKVVFTCWILIKAGLYANEVF